MYKLGQKYMQLKCRLSGGMAASYFYCIAIKTYYSEIFHLKGKKYLD